MSDTTITTAKPDFDKGSVTAPPTPGPGTALEPTGGSDLLTDHGKTSIADSVVSKIAGVAAREIDGVHAMGGTGARVIGAVRDKLGQNAHAQGVAVEVGERQAAIDLTIVVEYGVAIIDLSQGVRDNVIDRVERTTGLEVTEVNIDVTDVYIPGADESDEEDSRPDPPRVQ